MADEHLTVELAALGFRFEVLRDSLRMVGKPEVIEYPVVIGDQLIARQPSPISSTECGSASRLPLHQRTMQG